MIVRNNWDEYFMKFAELASERSNCLRRSVGAIVVRDKHILATGYNGPPRGFKHCLEVGCIRQRLNIPSGERSELCKAIHAEQNVIVQAARIGVSIKDSILYCTNQPCATCAKMIINAGIIKVFYRNYYNDQLAIELFQESSVELILI